MLKHRERTVFVHPEFRRAARRKFVAPGVVLAALLFLPLVHSQTDKPKSPAPTSLGLDGWGRPITAPAKDRKAAPAPRHDLSGTWEPSDATGTQILGAKAYPEDGKPEHRLPYTPSGLEALKRTKPGNGTRSVLPTETNDPVYSCDPQGFPRVDLHELRTTQIFQTPQNVTVLYQYNKIWRVIWTAGNSPKIPNRGGSDIRWASGWMITRWSSRLPEPMKELGLIEPAARIAPTCEWRSGSTAWTMIIWN